MDAADLPLPVGVAAGLAGAAVVVAFLVVSSRWTTPRLQEPLPRLVQGRWTGRVVAGLAALGMLGWVAVVLAGFADGSGSALNLAPVLVGVVFWVGIPAGSALIGDWWRHISPWRRLSRWVNRGVPERTDLQARVGVWPAVVSVLALGWLVRVSPDGSDPRTLAWAVIVYTVVVVAAGRIAGADTGLGMVDGFHSGYGAFGDVAAVDLGRDGLARPGWLRRLATLPESPGMPALVLSWAGVVVYDGLASTAAWAETFGAPARETWFATVALVTVVALVVAAYVVAASLTASNAGAGHDRATVARRFAHALVPVALGLLVSRYLGALLAGPQLFIAAASDPAGRGWELLGTAAWVPAPLLAPSALWTLQFLVLAAGGIAGALLAYDRALADFGPRLAVRAQYGMLALMVALTSLGVVCL